MFFFLLFRTAHIHRSLTHIITLFRLKSLTSSCAWVKQFAFPFPFPLRVRGFFFFFKINRILWINLCHVRVNKWPKSVEVLCHLLFMYHEFIFVDMTFRPFHMTLIFKLLKHENGNCSLSIYLSLSDFIDALWTEFVAFEMNSPCLVTLLFCRKVSISNLSSEKLSNSHLIFCSWMSSKPQCYLLGSYCCCCYCFSTSCFQFNVPTVKMTTFT